MTHPNLPSDPAAWIVELIEDFVAHSPLNRLGLGPDERAFDAPLVGFSSGADPLYQEIRGHVGSFYWTPEECFALSFPEQPAPAAELTVISWILPSTARVRQEQSAREGRPCERWFRVRALGEEFNQALRRRVVEALAEVGVPAVAPLLSPHWRRVDTGPYAPCSVWSERHAAFVGGLGTFGLCDGLITAKGKAHRAGSVVARLVVPPTPRPYEDIHAYCLFYTHGTCGKCIERCPVGALSPQGHDKRLCQQYTEVTMPRYSQEVFGMETPACGLCQSRVPCMDHIPAPEEG